MTRGGRRAAGFRSEPGAVPARGDPDRVREFRLRLVARARALGAAGFRHSLRDCARLRRHLPQQLLQKRHSADPPAARDMRAAYARTRGWAPNARMTVDLERQVVVRPNGDEIPFDIDPFRQASSAERVGRHRPDPAARVEDRRFRSAEAGDRRPGSRPSPSEERTAMPGNKKLLVLPGDGIGPEVMREVRRVIDWMDRRRIALLRSKEDLVGGASIDARGTPIAEATVQAAKRGGRGAVRRRRRAEMGQARLRAAARDRDPDACARNSTCSPISGRRPSSVR